MSIEAETQTFEEILEEFPELSTGGFQPTSRGFECALYKPFRLRGVPIRGL